tara:strand:+ start:527 stop:1258 length:732 start_codon:yes stop_codon:yes gene_type:complete
MTQHKDLSILLPVFNEGESVELMINILILYLKINIEIIVIYDHDQDSTIGPINILKKKYGNIKLIKNEKEGAKNAFLTGLKHANSDIILLTVVDEIFPILSYLKMYELIRNENYDLVSATRYSKGGLRLGGSILGHILSKFSNLGFNKIISFPLTDATTGIKMMKLKSIKSIILEAETGWSFALELSIKFYLKDFKITEVPIKSIDRIFGGKSTFKLIPWIKRYNLIIFWGIKEIIKKRVKKN